MNGDADIIYLDYAATTPVDPRVIDVMTPLFGADGDFANPSSGHTAGRRAMAARRARHRAARRAAGLPGERTGLDLRRDGVRQPGDHRCRPLSRRPRPAPDHDAHRAQGGLRRIPQAREAGLRGELAVSGRRGRARSRGTRGGDSADTQLVSIMHVNNETGVIQDIEALGALCRERGRAVSRRRCAVRRQGAAGSRLDAGRPSVATAHKIYGPQGRRRAVHCRSAGLSRRAADLRRRAAGRSAPRHARRALIAGIRRGGERRDDGDAAGPRAPAGAE